MAPELAAGLVLGGAGLTVGAVLLGFFLGRGWTRAAQAELAAEVERRERVELERQQALAALGAERQAHEDYARRAHTVEAEAARVRRLAADRGLSDVQLAERVLFGSAAATPAAGAAVHPAREGADRSG